MNLPPSENMATNFSQFAPFVLIRSNRVESTTCLIHPTLSRGAVFSKSHANRLLACRIDSRETIHVNLIESTRINNIFNPPSKPSQLHFLSLAQINIGHFEWTEGETIRVDSME